MGYAAKSHGQATPQRPTAERGARASSDPVFVDKHPGAIALRKLVDEIHNSVQGSDLFKLSHAIRNNPRVVAQRSKAPPALRAAMCGRGGLPPDLKSGIETLSGIDMSDVRVQTNSPAPAQINALAYTQGNQIHLGPGHERHLPHEAWHVVQQKQGRVEPTMQMKDGPPVNEDVELEREADVMGREALAGPAPLRRPPVRLEFLQPGVVQRHIALEDGANPSAAAKEAAEYAKHIAPSNWMQIMSVFNRWLGDTDSRQFANLKAAIRAIREYLQPDDSDEEEPRIDWSKIKNYRLGKQMSK